MTIRVQLQKRPRIAARATLGLRGYAGWVPQLAIIEDGDRRVHQVVDYFFGEGEKPPYIGWYVGPIGLTEDIAAAVDIRGDMAWSPVFALVSDGYRVVHQIIDWTGGSGSKPGTGYVSDVGISEDIGNGVDLRGFHGWGPVFGIVEDNNRRVYQLVDWMGGTGPKPSVLSETGETLFVGEAGYTTDLEQAIDMRGPPGAGQTAADTSFAPSGGLASLNVQDALEELAANKANVSALGALAGKSTVASGDVDNDAITNQKLANVTSGTAKGRISAGAGDPEDLTAVQLGVLLGRVGILEDYTGAVLPSGYLWPDGRNVSRTTYSLLFNATTIAATCTRTSGSTSLTSVTGNADALSQIEVGMRIEGAGIPAGTTVTAYSGTTITLSAAATSSSTGTAIRVFPHGNGDGSTTFGIVDARSRVIAGRDDMGGTPANRLTATSGVTGTKLGATGGDERMQQHSHNLPLAANAGGADMRYSFINYDGTGVASSAAGAGASQNVQPTIVLNKILFAGV